MNPFTHYFYPKHKWQVVITNILSLFFFFLLTQERKYAINQEIDVDRPSCLLSHILLATIYVHQNGPDAKGRYCILNS